MAKTQDIHREKISMEAENAMKFLSNIDGSQLDFTITRQMEESMKVKDTEYEMSSEFFIEIRNQEKNTSGLLFSGHSIHGDLILNNVVRVNRKVDFNDIEFIGEVVDKYPGIEISMVEPNFGICIYEYLRVHGIDELLVMCLEGLSVSLEDRKAEFVMRKVDKFFEGL